MKGKPSTILQKTYDDCYLICSTAVYFEGKNNEAEALRAWKNALDQLHYHKAFKLPSNFRPKTETEKALDDSLKELELQCKERVDLLEALQQTREVAPSTGDGSGQERRGSPSYSTTATAGGVDTSKWLGSGTVEPFAFPALSKPPSLPYRAPSSASVGESSRPPLTKNRSESSTRSGRDPETKSLRSSSPEKRGMLLKTLRQPGAARKPTPSSTRAFGSPSKPHAAQAATQAWGTKATSAYELAPSEKIDPTAAQSLSKSTEMLSATSSYDLPASSAKAAIKNSNDTGWPSNNTVNHVEPRKPNQSSSSLSLGERLGHGSKGRLGALDMERKHLSESPARTPAISRKQLQQRRPDQASNTAMKRGEGSTRSQKARRPRSPSGDQPTSAPESPEDETVASIIEPPPGTGQSEWNRRVASVLKELPNGIDRDAANQIVHEIVYDGDTVYFSDIAGLSSAKRTLKETVIYPFLRPDLFHGLREPARGLLLFGPPGTGKTMLARAVATESKSTFFAISAASLTSKWLGESEKLVRALFALARALAPSIIFVDEIDALLGTRREGEHDATRRVKTEFLIQWSDLARAAAGRPGEGEKERELASRVLVLAATNMPWAIDEAARRRFVRRQYIPLPEKETREVQMRGLLSHQKHGLSDEDIAKLVERSEGYSGSDITALAKDAAMGPLRSLGERLLEMTMDEIRPIQFEDFEASLAAIKPSVTTRGLQQFEEWANEFGERGS